MKQEDVLMLAKAGYTKDEINKMLATEQTTKPAEAQLNPQPVIYQTMPYQTAQPTIQYVQSPPPWQTPAYNYQTFVEQARKDNIINSQQPKEISPEEIMANVINPKDVMR